MRHRWLAAVSSLAIVAALLVAAWNIQLGQSDLDTIAKQGDAKAGLEALKDSDIGAGALLPHEVLVAGTDPETVASDMDGLAGVHGAVAPDRARGARTAPPLVEAFPTADGATSESRDTLDRVREAAHGAGPDVRVGGNLALNDDFIEAVYGNFPLMIALIGIITFLLLARAFRSLLLPAKAVLLNVLSIAAAWGVLVRGLAARLGLRSDLGHRLHGLGDVVDPADDLRVPVRALDGLRGVHPRPGCGRSTTRRAPRTRRSCAASAAPGGWSPARR